MLTNDERDASRTGGEQRRPPAIAVSGEGGELRCALSGVWTTRTVGEVDAEVRAIEAKGGVEKLSLDLSGIEKIDTAGAWLVDRLAGAHSDRGAEVKLSGQSAAARILLQAVGETSAGREKPVAEPGTPWFLVFPEIVGKSVYGFRDDFIAAMYILGSTIRGAQMKLGHGHAVNMAAIFNQIDRMGVGAIPVVILMSFIVGAIVAQQGAFQLRYFGAEIFVVDLVGILVLRELGVLMTAIMIAGRSGSAITAEIGSMKMREEIDALKVMGLSPIGVLVFPRLVALTIALPLLTIIANFAALFGAAVVAWAYSGITFDTFLARLKEAIDISTVVSGMIKAPFMALIIGIVASVEGLKVGGSAESLGRHVTASVVKSIFVVILVDGLFAMFYAAIDF